MMTIRRAGERGHADHGWLDTYHTFSFADYHDPAHMGFRVLRVINEDRVQPAKGFGTHGHKDMEILTYVLEGALAHADSMGNGSVIRPGEIQYMSAGKGVTHSEFNASKTDSVHLLQIWITPNEYAAQPRYAEKRFADEFKRNELVLLASPDGRSGSIAIRQDAQLFAGRFSEGERVRQPLAQGRSAWIQVARGKLQVDGQALSAGDGAAISAQREIDLTTREGAEFLLFDLP